MLYIAHFIFDVDERSESEQYGHFTCVTQAPDRESATAVFKKLLQELHAKELLFAEGVRTRVYLDVCVEFVRAPLAGILCHFEKGKRRAAHYHVPGLGRGAEGCSRI